jgi:hypothetical protein
LYRGRFAAPFRLPFPVRETSEPADGDTRAICVNS